LPKIVQALLGFARRSSPERKAVCLNSLVEASVEILHYQLRTSNVEAVMNLDPNLPRRWWIRTRFSRYSSISLITRARRLKRTTQSVIKIITATRGETVRVIIQDNGPGIAEENLSKIFDPFFTTKKWGRAPAWA